MRKLLILMLSVAAVPAFAADLPSAKSPPLYAPPPPVFSWTGIYIGANVGYVGLDNGVGTQGTDAASEDQISGGTVPPSYWLHPNGVTAGGQIGFNYEFPTSGGYGIVAGLEADYAYTDTRSSSSITNTDTGTSNAYSTSLDGLGTVRGRIGVAFDRALIYATGGLAYGRTNFSHNYLDQAGDPIWGGSQSSQRTGFVIGGGVEYALDIPSLAPGALTIRGEFLHYDLGTQTATIPFVIVANSGIGPFLDRYHVYGNLVRLGLNYKFDLFSSPAPVIAKY
ncbi:MAG: outer membrane protein [Methylovirgula sp.]